MPLWAGRAGDCVRHSSYSTGSCTAKYGYVGSDVDTQHAGLTAYMHGLIVDEIRQATKTKRARRKLFLYSVVGAGAAVVVDTCAARHELDYTSVSVQCERQSDGDQ